jgi:plasmid stabilization system protein ParE
MPADLGQAPASLQVVVGLMRDAVAQVAARDPHPTDPYRGLYLSVDHALSLGATLPPQALEERFDAVCERLRLSALERAVLAICAAPEVHPDLGRMFGYLHDDLARRAASPRLAARLLAADGVSDADVLRCFDEEAALRCTGALRLAAAGPLADRAVAVGGAIAAMLLGSKLGDAAERDRLRRLDRSPLPPGRPETARRLARALAGPRELPLVVCGPDAGLLLADAATHSGLVMLDARSAADAGAAADLALAAALEARVAVVDGLAELPEDGRARALEQLLALPCRPVIWAERREDALVLAEQPVLLVEVPRPSLAERTAAFREAAGSDAIGDVPARFRLDISRIGDAVAVARAESGAHGDGVLDARMLALGARMASSRRIGELAQRLAPGPTWDDLVLPARPLAGLHSMSSFLCHRDKVLEDWGYARVAGGQGLTALFAGESGTGKTLAARVVAGAAGLDVYRVDLAGLFSKWIGETEKNLDRVFRAAEGSNAVLFFDEADVVFGKRSEMKTSNDRYANLETAYLLQRIEGYDGVVILATNLRGNIDDAFVRRLDVVVDFALPTASTRRRLWRTLLPDAAPLTDGVDLDFLAERFELSGGGIRNCAVAAAFLAAEDGDVIEMAHLIRAVALEYAKLGRLTLQGDFGEYHELVRASGMAVPD